MELSHIDEKGNARMVDVSGKEHTVREAVASGRVLMDRKTLELIVSNGLPKGDVLSTARIAGVMAAKETYRLIPMCHNLPLDGIKVDLSPDAERCSIEVRATVKCVWKTGVEMEALTAASVACLTVFDMCKAVDKNMIIEDIKVLKKTGGKSGTFER